MNIDDDVVRTNLYKLRICARRVKQSTIRAPAARDGDHGVSACTGEATESASHIPLPASYGEQDPPVATPAP
jgi:hypothetical protein